MDRIYIIDISVMIIHSPICRPDTSYVKIHAVLFFFILAYRFKYHIARKYLMYVISDTESFIYLAIGIFRNVSENNTVYCFSLYYPIHKC